MEIIKKIRECKKIVAGLKTSGRIIGLVPTMGALHVGHISLIDRASADCDYTVVSIFVNPAQFGPGEDFNKYPRPLEADLKICAEHDVDLVFNPTPEIMYGRENLTWVDVEELTEPLCGRCRPGHFRGVTTVCAKLFNIVLPDIAYFGQKDAQQAVVIKKMVAELKMPLEIIVCPTVREKSGLAISSRNQYLTEQQRTDAAVIYKTLRKSEQLIIAGTTDSEKIISEMRRVLELFPSIQVEYVSIVDAETLRTVEEIAGKLLVAVSAKIGPAWLIDNILIDADKQ